MRWYLQKIDWFLKLVLVLVHTTGGQPARGADKTRPDIVTTSCRTAMSLQWTDRSFLSAVTTRTSLSGFNSSLDLFLAS